MRNKWSHNSILGITDTETVKLDFDNMPFKAAKYWAFKTSKWFRLGGFVILKSSRSHYHAVFDRKVSWTENVRIMAWISLVSHDKSLVKWFVMQCIKQGSTLRVSPKREKPSPRVVFCSGSRSSQVAEYLAYRTVVKSIIDEIQQNEKTEEPTERNKPRLLAIQEAKPKNKQQH